MVRVVVSKLDAGVGKGKGLSRPQEEQNMWVGVRFSVGKVTGQPAGSAKKAGYVQALGGRSSGCGEA